MEPAAAKGSVVKNNGIILGFITAFTVLSIIGAEYPDYIVAALAIKLSSRGPVFFRQDRYGLNGEIFRIYKFRTMKVDQGDASGRQQTVRDDPRVTWIGKFLRKSSLDELPQLLNILRGRLDEPGGLMFMATINRMLKAYIRDWPEEKEERAG